MVTMVMHGNVRGKAVTGCGVKSAKIITIGGAVFFLAAANTIWVLLMRMEQYFRYCFIFFFVLQKKISKVFRMEIMTWKKRGYPGKSLRSLKTKD